MISYLDGVIIYTSTSYVIVNVVGVGYKVFAVPELLTRPIGETVKIFTYHKSSDDGQALFGFPNMATLQFFELLMTVSGIGPKSALGIVSTSDMRVLKQAIANQDTAFFSQMGGIGKKTAERIIVELKDKIDLLPSGGTNTPTNSDVFNALVGLGYSIHEVRRIITEVDTTAPTESQLKQALKLLSKR